ncbi:hypothetical protein OJF2_41010 [Aquisphaera giovannonii]|uniref:Uncharacterized protein n=1 Tax=Aquisphaera giovannonii TaxID=406548 RepID=A0A5B9W4V2_9BACT|nr:hypothetical protein [Aquisphaera giovannonii]QEH35548.1 hypothetical protein OJF2_41010 [Aquisphaera giovannonii]
MSRSKELAGGVLHAVLVFPLIEGIRQIGLAAGRHGYSRLAVTSGLGLAVIVLSLSYRAWIRVPPGERAVAIGLILRLAIGACFLGILASAAGAATGEWSTRPLLCLAGLLGALIAALYAIERFVPAAAWPSRLDEDGGSTGIPSAPGE